MGKIVISQPDFPATRAPARRAGPPAGQGEPAAGAGRPHPHPEREASDIDTPTPESGTLDKRALIDLLLEAGALQFGAFTLRSGRESPYFFNAGRFNTGRLIRRLGEVLAQVCAAAAPRATIVFGPAYKGIPLALTTAMALSEGPGRDVGYLFDRKEQKTHGDAGNYVGRLPGPEDRLVLVDDVITDGQTKLEAVARLRETFTAPIDALVIAFNRMERDGQGRDALREFERATGIPVHAALSLADLQETLEAGRVSALAGDADAWGARLRDYRARYGVEA